MRFGGRATVTVPPLAMAELEACLALLGGFLADMDGEGEEEAAVPFVCMPAGIRFVLGCGGSTGGGIGVVLGAIATVCYPGNAQRAVDQAPRPGVEADAVVDASCLAESPQLIQRLLEGRDSVAFVRVGCRMGTCLVRRDGIVPGEVTLMNMGWQVDARSKKVRPPDAVQPSGTMGETRRVFFVELQSSVATATDVLLMSGRVGMSRDGRWSQVMLLSGSLVVLLVV